MRDEETGGGASVWGWAGTASHETPDVVLAAAGDIPTMETVVAAWWLRQRVPDLRVCVVNVVDLATLFPPDVHPHGMEPAQFAELFTDTRPWHFEDTPEIQAWTWTAR